jgi:hypothetical protein
MMPGRPCRDYKAPKNEEFKAFNELSSGDYDATDGLARSI